MEGLARNDNCPKTGSNPGRGSDSSSEISEESSFCHPIERANRQNGIRIHQNQIPIRSGFESRLGSNHGVVSQLVQLSEAIDFEVSVAGPNLRISQQREFEQKCIRSDSSNW